MAAGEFVSVSSHATWSWPTCNLKRRELAEDPEGELRELAAIYEGRGLSVELAQRVAEELSGGDRLAVHARDELGIEQDTLARPLQAACVVSAVPRSAPPCRCSPSRSPRPASASRSP